MPKNKGDTAQPWLDPDDAPELPDEVLGRVAVLDGDRVLRPAQGTLTRRGRPRLANPKRLVTLRLDGDLIERLRQAGPGWQTRVNEILRKEISR